MTNTNFEECPLYVKAHESITQTQDIHNIISVMRETLKWHKIIGYCFIVSFLTLGLFVLLEAKDKTKVNTAIATTQAQIVKTLDSQLENTKLLNKNIGEASMISLKLTAEYMRKMVVYEKGLDSVIIKVTHLEKLLNKNYEKTHSNKNQITYLKGRIK